MKKVLSVLLLVILPSMVWADSIGCSFSDQQENLTDLTPYHVSGEVMDPLWVTNIAAGHWASPTNVNFFIQISQDFSEPNRAIYPMGDLTIRINVIAAGGEIFLVHSAQLIPSGISQGSLLVGELNNKNRIYYRCKVFKKEEPAVD